MSELKISRFDKDVCRGRLLTRRVSCDSAGFGLHWKEPERNVFALKPSRNRNKPNIP